MRIILTTALLALLWPSGLWGWSSSTQSLDNYQIVREIQILDVSVEKPPTHPVIVPERVAIPATAESATAVPAKRRSLTRCNAHRPPC